MKKPLVALLGMLLLTACEEKVLVIESNTAWAGEIIPGGAVSGSGNAEIDLTDAPSNVCWSLHKTTTLGTLRAYLRDETWFGLGTEYDDDMTTIEPNGVVGGCNR